MTSQTDLMDIPSTRATLAELQGLRRRSAVKKAMESPFFQGRLDHLNAHHITQAEEWDKIPVLDKEELRGMDSEAFYTKFCTAPREDIIEFWRSGGSTGKPLFYPRTARDIHYGQLGFKRALDLAGFTASDITHMSLPLGIHPAGHMMARSGSDMGVGMVWAWGGNTLPSGAQLDLMRMFHPTAWIGMASYGIQLANLARAEGFDLAGSGIEKILCSAEPLSDIKREKLADLWGAPVRDCYGMTEMMMLGCEDAACDGFRFWSDYCFPEVVDETTFEPVPEGTPGLLIVTSLVTNNATPFLRWNTGDIVTMRSKINGAGAYDVFPLIRHTHRTAGFVKVRGVNVGFAELEDLMFADPQVSDFKVEIVWENDRDEMDVSAEVTGDEATTKTRIRDKIQRTFGVKPRVVIGTAGGIATSFEGQFKPVRIADRRGA